MARGLFSGWNKIVWRERERERKKKPPLQSLEERREIAANPSDTSVCRRARWGCVYISLVYEWTNSVCTWSRASARRSRSCLCAAVPCEGNLLNSNYSTLHSKRLMRPHPSGRKTFTASDLASGFSIRTAVPLPRHTPPLRPLFLKKIRKKSLSVEMNFIAPFSLPLLIDKGTTQKAPSATSALLLLKERKGKWILQPLVVSVALTQPPPPPEVAHSGTLPSLSHYLTQRLEMNFTAPALFFSPQCRPIVTHPRCSYCLSSLPP